MGVQEIQNAIACLPPDKLTELSAWFVEYRHQQWDEQIADDLESGRLDHLLGEVEKEYEAALATLQ
jgi:hypothetical protein